jgi:hypothetical protein
MSEAKVGHTDSRGALWSATKDGLKVILTFVLGAATYFGSPLPLVLRQHWLVVGLVFALIMMAYTMVRREKDHHSGHVFAAMSLQEQKNRVQALEDKLRDNASLSGLVSAFPRRANVAMSGVLEELRTAKFIGLMGFNLRSRWFTRHGYFDDIIRPRLQSDRDLSVKILIANLSSEALKFRELCEDGGQTGRMIADGTASLGYLRELLKAHAATHCAAKLEVRLVEAGLIRCSLTLFEDRILMTSYLARRGANRSPTFEIVGPASDLYKVYREEFEELWESSLPYSVLDDTAAH